MNSIGNDCLNIINDYVNDLEIVDNEDLFVEEIGECIELYNEKRDSDYPEDCFYLNIYYKINGKEIDIINDITDLDYCGREDYEYEDMLRELYSLLFYNNNILFKISNRFERNRFGDEMIWVIV